MRVQGVAISLLNEGKAVVARILTDETLPNLASLSAMGYR